MQRALIHLVYFVVIAGMLYVNAMQANTIINQQRVIHDMIMNPYCLVPEVK